MENVSERRPGGRSARVRRAVLDAAFAELVEHGPAGFSIGSVASRAGVHETSIYRRWRTRENVMGEALLDHSATAVPVPDTGSLLEDLTAFGEAVASLLATPAGVALVRTAALSADDPAGAAVRREFWAARLNVARTIVARAAARAEIPASTDARLVLETLVAPLHMRVLLTGGVTDDALPRRLATLLCDGLVPGGPPESA